MEVGAGKSKISLLIHGQRWADVEEHDSLHALWEVDAKFVGNASPAVVGTDREDGKAEGRHDRSTVAGHGAFGVFDVAATAWRFGGGTVAAEVQGNNGELAG